MNRKRTKINFTGGNVVLCEESAPNKSQPPVKSFIDKITADGNTIKISTKVSNANNKFDEFVKYFADEVIKMDLTQKTTNKIFNLCDDLMQQYSMLLTEVINAKVTDDEAKKIAVENIISVHDRIRQQIKSNNSQFKRNKIQKQNNLYVAPEEKAIGLKWIEKSSVDKDIRQHQLTQTTFQYIPIVKTLKSLFQRDDFRNMYFEYNSQKHVRNNNNDNNNNNLFMKITNHKFKTSFMLVVIIFRFVCLMYIAISVAGIISLDIYYTHSKMLFIFNLALMMWKFVAG